MSLNWSSKLILWNQTQQQVPNIVGLRTSWISCLCFITRLGFWVSLLVLVQQLFYNLTHFDSWTIKPHVELKSKHKYDVLTKTWDSHSGFFFFLSYDNGLTLYHKFIWIEFNLFNLVEPIYKSLGIKKQKISACYQWIKSMVTYSGAFVDVSKKPGVAFRDYTPKS